MKLDRPLKQTLLAWLIVVFGGRSFTSPLVLPVLLLYVPIFFYYLNRERVGFLDQNFRVLGRSVLVFLLFTLALVIPVFSGNHFYQGWLGLSYQAKAVPGLARIILEQIVLVSLPEEFFFRGFMQEYLNRYFGRAWRLLGVACGPGLIWTALLFAVSHSFIQYQWWHIFIFFPALAFGWLRDKTGSITAPILFHASSNIFAQWVYVNYR